MAHNEDLAQMVRAQRVTPEEVAQALEGGKAMVRVVDQFPKGTTVRLIECAPGASEVPAGKPVATAKSDKDTVVEFDKGVRIGQTYFVAGEIEQDGEKFIRSMKVRGKFHPKDERVRPASAATDVGGPEVGSFERPTFAEVQAELSDDPDAKAARKERSKRVRGARKSVKASEDSKGAAQAGLPKGSTQSEGPGASELKDVAKKGSSDAQPVEKAAHGGQTPKIKG